MYGYIKGTIKEIESNYIILDNNGIGYLIYTPNPYSFNLDEEYTVYIYQSVKEDELTLYGFKLKEEKDLFLKSTQQVFFILKLLLYLQCEEIMFFIN